MSAFSHFPAKRLQRCIPLVSQERATRAFESPVTAAKKRQPPPQKSVSHCSWIKTDLVSYGNTRYTILYDGSQPCKKIVAVVTPGGPDGTFPAPVMGIRESSQCSVGLFSKVSGCSFKGATGKDVKTVESGPFHSVEYNSFKFLKELRSLRKEPGIFCAGLR